ncbi:MAG TPA: ROK family transcriptional regulator [Jatrophihabitantaceae bacterium]|jgi:predicted NBD/HSP70 family sugar kinase
MVSSVLGAARTRTREQLFDVIRSRGDVTRAELAALTGLPQSTINQSINQLVADGRISAVDSETKGPGSGRGRPASRLRAVAAGAAVAGIDFGHSHVHVGVADPLGRTIDTAHVRLDVDTQATQAMDLAATMLNRLLARHNLPAPSAVVAGIPGPVDLSSGLVCSPTILSGWVGLAPATEIGTRIGADVHIENDAALGALGQVHARTDTPLDTFLYVKASHGIGASVVIGGELYRGTTGLAGEIGHTHLPGRSELCRCGNRGCLEAAVSVTTIRAQIAHTRPGTSPESINLADVHDPIAARILAEAGRTLGRVLADLANLLNPAAVIIGGELGAVDQPLIDGVRESIQRHAQPAIADALRVQPATLGIDTELIGALQLAAQLAAAR